MNSFQLSDNNDQLGDLPSLNNFANSLLMIGTANGINGPNSMNFLGNNRNENDIDEEDSLGIRLKIEQKSEKVPNNEEQMERSTPRKKRLGCTCKKTNCLKMYCECFSSGRLCKEGCNCHGCSNLEEFHLEIEQAKLMIKSKGKAKRKCTCHKSHCQKKYCQCYNSGISCTSQCKCVDCHNENKDIEEKQAKEDDRKEIRIEQPNSFKALLI